MTLSLYRVALDTTDGPVDDVLLCRHCMAGYSGPFETVTYRAIGIMLCVECADVLRDNPDCPVAIAGFTDPTPVSVACPAGPVN